MGHGPPYVLPGQREGQKAMKSRTVVNKGRLFSRQGLRIRGRGADPEVRTALIQFARWLRSQYDFPIRVPVYLYPSEMLLTMHGERVSASFVAPGTGTLNLLSELQQENTLG